MSFHELTNRLQTITEMTDGSAIAALPSGFVSTKYMQKAFRTGGSKREHGLEIRERRIREAQESAYEMLEEALTGMLLEKQNVLLDVNVNEFVNTFTNKSVKTNDNVLFKYESLAADIKAFVEKCKKTYGEDFGTVQALATSIRDRIGVGNFEVTKGYSFLVGARIVATAFKESVTYTGAIDMGFVPSEKVELASSELAADADEELKGVIVSGNVITPEYKVFSRNLCKDLFKLMKDKS